MINKILLITLMVYSTTGYAQESMEHFLKNQPIIDMHYHITKGYKDNEIYNAMDTDIDKAKLKWSIENFNKNNIVLVIGGGNLKYANMYAKADDRIWAGLIFPCRGTVKQDEPCTKTFFSEDELREIYKNEKFRSMGESLYNYYGVPPTDERLSHYWKIASEFNLPIGIHSDSGPPTKQVIEENPNYNPKYANPALLSPILEKYPDLKIYLMHFGNEYSDEAIQIMKKYPQIYCEISAVSIFLPKVIWEPNLRKLYEAGLGDRLMFGSDYFGTVEKNLKIIFEIDWLTDKQKRDILYNNAARFLNLPEELINKHHEDVKLPAQAHMD